MYSQISLLILVFFDFLSRLSCPIGIVWLHCLPSLSVSLIFDLVEVVCAFFRVFILFDAFLPTALSLISFCGSFTPFSRFLQLVFLPATLVLPAQQSLCNLRIVTVVSLCGSLCVVFMEMMVCFAICDWSLDRARHLNLLSFSTAMFLNREIVYLLYILHGGRNFEPLVLLVLYCSTT